MKQALFVLLLSLAMNLAPPHCRADNKVVVIPLRTQSSLQNMVTVAKSGGDYNNLFSAVAAINDAGATKPYIIYIAPGIYDMGAQSLVMKEYVSIVGAGQGVSVLKWVQNASTIVAGTSIRTANKAHIANLTIEQLASGTYAVGVVNDGSSPTISNIEVIQTSFASTTIGIFSNNSAAPDISSTDVTLQGIGAYNYGVFNLAASPTINDIKVKVMFGAVTNVAIRNDASSAVLNNVRAIASSSALGASAIGLQCITTGRPVITNSSFEANGTGTAVYGLEIQFGSSGARIINSRVVGNAKDDAAGTQCLGLYDANLGSISC